MSSQKVLIIESDQSFAASLQSMLEPYGFDFEIIGDGAAGLARAKEAPPDLIILCVELPKMSGYAVCNKLKKNKTLKKVPLVIMSAEATPETFEQHKKLKTRADEYILKDDGFTQEMFIEKVGGVFELEAVEDGSGDVFDETPEASMGESEVVEEDPDLDVETDAAFASLEVEEGDMMVDDASVEEEELEDLDIEDLDAESFEVDDDSLEEEEVSEDEMSLDEDMMDLGLDEVVEDVSTEEEASVVEESGESKKDVPEDLFAQMEGLKKERDELEKKLQEALSSKGVEGSESSISREREFLNLREVINKKERQVLDLNESLDAKERDILDKKEAIRKLERTKQELDEKILVVERDKFEVQEKAGNLEKEYSSLKETLQKSQEDNQGLQNELDSLRESFEQEKAALESELVTAKAATQETIEAKEKEVVSLKKEHEEAMEGLKGAHGEELEKVRGEHEEAMEGLKRAHGEELEKVRGEHEEAMEGLKRAHGEELEKVRREHEEDLKSQKESLEVRVTELEDEIKEKEGSLVAIREEKEKMVNACTAAQEQLDSADERMKGNKAVVDRTKQALAVALTLLEEQFAYPDDEESDEPSAT